MVVYPRLVGVLLRRRSNWKPVVETDIFVLQHHPRQQNMSYRIITRGFPHYRGKSLYILVAEGDSISVLQEELAYLSQHARVSIQGKITSKKIANWLKGTITPSATSPPEDHLHHDEDEEEEEEEELQDEDGYLSDLSTLSNEDMVGIIGGMDKVEDGGDETYTTTRTRASVTGRLLRRAISLEDMNNKSSFPSEIRHLLLLQEDGLPERPASSASMTIPVPSDTLPSHRHHDQLHHYQLQPPYELEYYHRHFPQSQRRTSSSAYGLGIDNNHRSQSAMSLRQHDEDSYTLYGSYDNNSHNIRGGATSMTRAMDQDDPEDPLLTSFGDPVLSSKRPVQASVQRRTATATSDDGKSVKSTYTLSPTLTDHPESRSRSLDESTMVGADTRADGGGPLGWIYASSPILDAIVNWVEGPASSRAAAAATAAGSQATKKNEKPNPILDIPFQFIALLTYPEQDPKMGNKMSLAMVREMSFVRQRRKTLLMLTAYTLLVRYCSFDFFLLLLFASNCGMLFLMKNSGRMNVNMAKRAVNQRVGWAKQWAGGIFRRGGGATANANHGNGNGTGVDSAAQQGTTYSNASSSKSIAAMSIMQTESIRGAPAASILGDKLESAQEEGQQVKRRGLFGKRKTINSISSARRSGSGASIITPSIIDGVGAAGDELSQRRVDDDDEASSYHIDLDPFYIHCGAYCYPDTTTGRIKWK
ncbi:hypothetical protein BGZ58_002599 [Dissophora ornata]|nr:hypothetical protein BGZ58_002599 [Dissophora ornata]